MKKGNLLIVDDEVLIVENLQLTLKESADQIFMAYNGLEALEVWEKEEVHCIICDIKMPKMTGVDLIKEIRARGSDVPFIFYTGHGNELLMKEAAKYGAFDFLDKPNLNGLIDVIVLGLKKGFERKTEDSKNWEEVQTEYAKMLSDLIK
jgi:YesN/AraC family two-component response regulator